METIALVACAKAKRPGRHQAKNLYHSTLFTYSRKYAETHADRWFILSAKHGLVHPDSMLDFYYGTLKNVPLPVKNRWAHKVYDQIKALNLDPQNTRIMWLAGNDYKSELSPMLTRFRQDDPLRNMKLGDRMAWLKSQIEDGSEAPTGPTPTGEEE